MTGATDSPAARRPRRVLLRRLVQLALVGFATWFIAIPQLPVAWRAVGELASARTTLTALGAVCAVAALFAYAELMRTMLDHHTSPGLWHTFGIVTTSLGVSNVLPAGSAVGSVVTFRMLERAGVPRPRAAAAMAVTSLGSAVVLNVLLGMGLIVLLPTRGLASGAIAAVPTLALLAALVLVARATARRRPRLWAAATRLERRFPRLLGTRLSRALDALAEQLEAWHDRPSLWRRALFWAVVNWLVDVAALWIVLASVGVVVNPTSVLVAFALANLAAMVPITPGGLGVVEFTLTATLVGLGAPASATAIGVAIYRLFNYWAPIPVSAVSYAATRALSPRPAVAG